MPLVSTAGGANPPGAGGGGRSAWRALFRVFLLGAAFALAGLAMRTIIGKSDTALVDRFVAGRGLWGEAAFLAAGAAITAVGLPRQTVAFAGGYAFGPLFGVLLALAAQLGGACACFGLARFVFRDGIASAGRPPGAAHALILRNMGQRAGAWAKALGVELARAPFLLTLTLRLLPVGSNLGLNIAAGLSGLPAGRFLAATALGYLPQTIVFASLGTGTRVGRMTEVALAAGLFLASSLLGLVLLRRARSVALSAGSE